MESPIIFKGEMVRAILDGVKTQTRRVIKPQPIIELKDCGSLAYWICSKRLSIRPWLNGTGFNDTCPFGQKGDRLWVRETWAKMPESKSWFMRTCNSDSIIYKADWSTVEQKDFKWKPSIHMKRETSRLDLLITNVRIQRLQDISQEEAIAEGMFDLCPGIDYAERELLSTFASYWDSAYSETYPWESNPWVWVLDFSVADQEVD